MITHLLKNIMIGFFILISILLITPSEVVADRVYFNGSIQGVKYGLSFVEGTIDPSFPDRGYIEMDLITVRSFDLILFARKGLDEDAGPPTRRVQRINASAGAPRKEHFMVYLDNLGLEDSGQGLLAIIIAFPIQIKNQTLVVAYRSDGEKVQFKKVEIPIQ